MNDDAHPIAGVLAAALIVGHGRRAAPHRDAHERIARLVYLADWKSCIERGRQITALEWRFQGGAPRLDEAVLATTEIMAVLPPFRPQADRRLERIARTLPSEHADVVAHVVAATRDLDRFGLWRLVASTWPSLTESGHGGPADLAACARAYAAATSRAA